MSITTVLASAAIATGALAAVGGASAQAAPAAPAATQVLEVLCEARGGSFFVTPFALARCQEARAGRGGFRIEQAICTHLLDGEFVAVASFGAPEGRFTWVCR